MIRTLTITLVYDETNRMNTKTVVDTIKEVLEHAPDPILVVEASTRTTGQSEVDAFKAAFDR